MTQDFWNDRYGIDAYAYGTEPNKFLKESLSEFEMNDKILFPAEGEGRNAVFAAQLGLNVTAFDISKEGRNKALKLAKSHNIKLNYLVGALEELNFDENSFDFIALIYAHFPANIKSIYHRQLGKFLKKGGIAYFIIKSQSIDISKNPEIVFNNELNKIKNNFDILEKINIEPYDKKHLFVILRKI